MVETPFGARYFCRTLREAEQLSALLDSLRPASRMEDDEERRMVAREVVERMEELQAAGESALDEAERCYGIEDAVESARSALSAAYEELQSASNYLDDICFPSLDGDDIRHAFHSAHDAAGDLADRDEEDIKRELAGYVALGITEAAAGQLAGKGELRTSVLRELAEQRSAELMRVARTRFHVQGERSPRFFVCMVDGSRVQFSLERFDLREQWCARLFQDEGYGPAVVAHADTPEELASAVRDLLDAEQARAAEAEAEAAAARARAEAEQHESSSAE